MTTLAGGVALVAGGTPVLDHFGVTEATWRDAVAADPHFAAAESPAYIGRAVVALASDPTMLGGLGSSFATGELAHAYGFTDIDGSQPDFVAYDRGASAS